MLSPRHLHHQPAGYSDCSKNYLTANLKFLPLPQSPKKTRSGRHRLVVKQNPREGKTTRILGQPSVVFYRLQVESIYPELKDKPFRDDCSCPVMIQTKGVAGI